MADAKKKTTGSKGVKAATTKRNGKPSKKEPEQRFATAQNENGRNIGALVMLLLGVLAVVSMFSSDAALLSWTAKFLKGIFGWGYWIIGFSFIYIAYLLFFVKSKPIGFRVICLVLMPVFFSSLINIVGDFTIDSNVSDLFDNAQRLNCGGVLGGAFAALLVNLIGKIGGGAVLVILLVVMLFGALGADSDTFKRNEVVWEDDGYPPERKPSIFEGKSIINSVQSVPAQQVRAGDYNFELQSAKKPRGKKAQTSPAGSNKASGYDIPMLESEEETKPARQTRKSAVSSVKVPEIEPVKSVDGSRKVPISIEKPLSASTPEDVKKPEKISRKDVEKETEAVAKEISDSEQSATVYTFPGTELLNYGSNNGSDTNDTLYATQDRLETTLHSFGIMSNVVKITPGPTVTRYDIELEQGVKLAKVTNLAGDLALALGVLNVRVAPIPDEISTVGIEVPNKIVNTVSLREIIESKEFSNGKSRLTFAIGKDIGGHSIVGDISKLPHMLIAGTTGSGKSVCMNSLIISLLYKARPDEVKFIMIDPKMVELGIYNAIPHLYVPVVTEPKKAAGALQWAVVEMLKRYRLFSEAGVRDLETYNKWASHNEEQTLPQVVILIDELADLMMAASKEVEESICRVAQMGRAAGMHLIIATQRPSADVITGLMKANIPSRIAFAVSSAMESRIIMDTSGAEKLVGHGDMLYSPLGSGKPLRVQGSFVSDEERERVIEFIKANSDCKAEHNEEIAQYMNKESTEAESAATEKASSPANEYDEMLPQAVEVVLEMKSCSVSMLQRRLKLGYSRAARIVDQMEELGVVGPYEGAKPRTVPITRDDWNEIQVSIGLASEDDFALASEMSEEADEDIYVPDEID